jgi:hypothetical protein
VDGALLLNKEQKRDWHRYQSLFRSFEPLVGLDIRKACRRQAYKENLQQSSESKLSLTAEDSP